MSVSYQISPVEFGQRVRLARTARGLHQAALAQQVGCHELSISRIERGLFFPGLGLVLKIASVLGVKIESLVG